MSFMARCPECRKRVTVMTWLDGDTLDRVLKGDGHLEVLGFLCEHRWKLKDEDKTHLRSLRSRTKA